MNLAPNYVVISFVSLITFTTSQGMRDPCRMSSTRFKYLVVGKFGRH